MEEYQSATAPEQAVFGAYRQLGNGLRELLSGGGSVPFNAAMPDLGALGQEAFDRQLITADTLHSLRGLEVMYQLAKANPDEVTTERAQEFRTLVNAVLYVLESAKRRQSSMR